MYQCSCTVWFVNLSSWVEIKNILFIWRQKRIIYTPCLQLLMISNDVFCCLKNQDRTRHSQYICLHLAMVTKRKLCGSKKENFSVREVIKEIITEIWVCRWIIVIVDILHCFTTKIDAISRVHRNYWEIYAIFIPAYLSYDVAFHKVDFYLARLIYLYWRKSSSPEPAGQFQSNLA